MLTISSELKQLYINDTFPTVSVNLRKDLEITFASIPLVITTESIVDDSFELTENLCTEDQLEFGRCESAMIKFTLADISNDLSGLEFSIVQKIEGYDDLPLGVFKVFTCERQDDLRFKDITAYDMMQKFDVDVSAWYRALYPTDLDTHTVAQIRASLCAYVGVEEIVGSNINDDMIVTKTLSPTSGLKGRDVLQQIEVLSGSFGHINRLGQLVHLSLMASFNDYPQMDYPQMDYPMPETYESVSETNNTIALTYEDYITGFITKLIIRQEEADIGCIYGTGTNAYIIQGNFLLYGKSALELTAIATGIYNKISTIFFRPFEASTVGLPYIEVGDYVNYNYVTSSAPGYVLTRTLSGIQALRDIVSCKGKDEYTESFGVAMEIIQLKGRTATITKNVDELTVTVADLDTELSGEISTMAGQVVLKVNTAGNIGFIELNGDPDTDLTQISVKADNISLEGLVTINGGVEITTAGNLNVNGGTLTASNINSPNINTYDDGIIQSSSWDGQTFGVTNDEAILTQGKLTVRKTTHTSGGVTFGYQTDIEGGTINTRNITAEFFGEYGNLTPNAYFGSVTTNLINGGDPITTANKNNYTYPPAISGFTGSRTINPYTFDFVNGICTAVHG